MGKKSLSHKNKKGELSERILEIVLHTGAVTLDAIVEAHMVMMDFQLGARTPRALEYRKVQRAIERLKNRKVLTYTIEQGVKLVRFDVQHYEESPVHARRECLDAQKEEWDGRWRILMFDIPNHLKKKRDDFRRSLYAIHMMQIQKSVYVLPFPCKKYIIAVAKALALTEYLVYFEADTYEGVEDIMKYYSLKTRQ